VQPPQFPVIFPQFNSVATIEYKLGRRIAALRQRVRMTQAKLAEISGYSDDFIGLVERGINAPSVSGLERIAKALKVPLKDLFDF
jgi:transcriptional regulator with XRE-family HTH domain